MKYIQILIADFLTQSLLFLPSLTIDPEVVNINPVKDECNWNLKIMISKIPIDTIESLISRHTFSKSPFMVRISKDNGFENDYKLIFK